MQASLICGLRDRGHEVAVLAEVDAPEALYVGSLAAKSAASLARAVIISRKYGPDVVLCERPQMLPASAVVASALKKPLVFHSHDMPPAWLGAKQVRWALRRISMTAAVSGVVAAAWKPYVSKVCVIHNGLTDRAVGVGSDPPLVLFAGRFVADKGVGILLDAWEMSDRLRERASLRLVGVTAQADAFADRARILGAEVVQWTRDVADHIAAADVVAVPSIHVESFGMAVLEALAAAVPVIASRTGGIPEIIGPLDRLLVSAGNAAELAHALETTIMWRKEDPALGGLCRERAGHFTVAGMVTQMEEVLGSA